MFSCISTRWLATALSLLATSISAQTGEPPGGAMPVPGAQPAPYRSTLEGYQPFTDEKVAPWKSSNDTVNKVGGWKAYAKEAREPDAGPGTQPPAPAIDPHADHKH